MPPVRIAVVIIVSSGGVPCSRDEMEVSMPAMISAKVMIDTARQPERGSAARRRAPTSSDGLGLSAATALATAQTMNGPATFTPATTAPIISTMMVMPVRRSEEHTSELQSRGHLVCRLLLEKKKNKQ